MKNLMIFVLLIIIAVFIIYNLSNTGYLPSEISNNINSMTSGLALNRGWRGYSSYESFAKAANIDEFLGNPINEEGFKSLMALAFLGQFFSPSDDVQINIVSGTKLTEIYSVPESLWHNYDYLFKESNKKGSTNYIAYFNGENWVIVYWIEKWDHR